jgi:hypothetical protein
MRRHVAAAAAALVLVAHAAASTDWRALTSGTVMLEDAYLDQPYCVIWSNSSTASTLSTSTSASTASSSSSSSSSSKLPGGGRWLCTITRNNASEGHADEHAEILYSDDAGATWTTGIRLEPPTNPDNAYGVIVQTTFGRVYVIYNMNLDRVSKLPDGSPISRDDEIGHFVMRYTDDGGDTWSADRYEVPYALTSIDRNNSWKGAVKIMWSVDQVKVRGGRTFHAFTKIGTYPQSPPEQVFLLSSPNLLTEPNASLVTWDLLPSGDVGLSAPVPATTNWEEGHVIPLSESPGFFALCRTNLGYLGAAFTADPTGSSGWSSPGLFVTYWNALPSAAGRRLKNPQGPITLKRFVSTGRYLFLFYLNSFPGYGERNPVFISSGVEEDGQVRFSQPEIVLYDYEMTADNRPGYPDFIEDPTNGAVYITETNKTIARIHLVDNATLSLLWRQDAINETALDGLAISFTPSSQGKSFPTPSLPDLTPSSYKPGVGVTIALWLADHAAAQPGQVLVDVGTLRIGVASGGALQVNVTDSKGVRSNLTMDADCTARLLSPVPAGFAGHYAAVVVDGGAHVLTMSVDGAVCDGGEKDIFGFAWISALTGSLGPGDATFVLGGGGAGGLGGGGGGGGGRGEGGEGQGAVDAYGGRIVGGQWYSRYLLNSEVVGNYRMGLVGHAGA